MSLATSTILPITDVTISDIVLPEGSDYLSRFAYICMLSFDVYMIKQIIERIIDETLENEPKKK